MAKMIDPQVLLSKLQVIGGGWEIAESDKAFVACIKKTKNIELSVTCSSMVYEESPIYPDSFDFGFSVMDHEAGDYIFDYDDSDIDFVVQRIKDYLNSRISDFRSLIGQ